MKKTLLAVLVTLIPLLSGAQGMDPAARANFAKIFWRPTAKTVKLYENDGPVRSTPQKADFTEALLEIYSPREDENNGLCVIMCPGGGYAGESQSYEGRDFAPWFTSRGMTYCMLQYRLPNGNHTIPLSDAEAAMEYLRSHADELGIRKIGIAGCSAGGHLASTLATHYSSTRTRPDFQILLYPVITMDESFTHQGSRDNLLGTNPSQELVDRYSNEKQVTKDTPEAFIVLASDDFLVPVKNSTRYYEALVEKGVGATLLCYPTGNHGFGNNDTFKYRNNYLDELDTWIYKTLLK